MSYVRLLVCISLFRIALEMEARDWKPFRNVLDKKEKGGKRVYLLIYSVLAVQCLMDFGSLFQLTESVLHLYIVAAVLLVRFQQDSHNSLR
jgi:hypothetical protein